MLSLLRTKMTSSDTSRENSTAAILFSRSAPATFTKSGKRWRRRCKKGWSNGVNRRPEYWSDGVMGAAQYSSTPTLRSRRDVCNGERKSRFAALDGVEANCRCRSQARRASFAPYLHEDWRTGGLFYRS